MSPNDIDFSNLLHTPTLSEAAARDLFVAVIMNSPLIGAITVSAVEERLLLPVHAEITFTRKQLEAMESLSNRTLSEGIMTQFAQQIIPELEHLLIYGVQGAPGLLGSTEKMADILRTEEDFDQALCLVGPGVDTEKLLTHTHGLAYEYMPFLTVPLPRKIALIVSNPLAIDLRLWRTVKMAISRKTKDELSLRVGLRVGIDPGFQHKIGRIDI